MEKVQYEEVRKKIKQLNNETSSYLLEIKRLLQTRKQKYELKLISYFSFSLNFAHEKDQESLIIGTYHIHNLGSKLLSNPYICIKLGSDSPFSFSGKYINKASQSIKTNNSWERINDQQNKFEYWLRPTDKKAIEPGEVISFSNFQLSWSYRESYSGSVLGFTYTDEMKDGLPAVNQIYINGS
ncbi:hypothetical protein ACERII_06555 [Evansella sp. AB-rgal1]|uniref:hypothetical protein n=1 Tax=Evansella sp. AB-rgal1 TaxID=3242696 RepID=UPI00359DD9A4